MSTTWLPANLFLGARKSHALANGRSLDWIEADIIVALKASELAARGQPVSWRRVGPDDELLAGSGLERELGQVAEIPAEFWDSLIFHGGWKDWETCHFAVVDRISGQRQEFDAVQISQPMPSLPPDADILAKAQAMMAQGFDRDAVARSLRIEPGFEAVTNEHVRRLLKGTRPRGRPQNTPTG